MTKRTRPALGNFAASDESFTTYEVVITKTAATLIERYSLLSNEMLTLPIEVFEQIEDTVKAHFNARLMKLNIKPGRWGRKTTLDKLLGKELALLMLGLNGATEVEQERVIANWCGLQPEERWWLYTQIFSVGRDRLDIGKGWYKGIMIALREN